MGPADPAFTGRLRNPASPVRVAIVLGKLSFYGAPRQTLQLARRLPRDKYRLEVWVMSGVDELAPLAREWGIPVFWLARGCEVGPGGVLGLARRLLAQRPDILFPVTTPPNIWARPLGRLAGVPVIVGNIRVGSPAKQFERWLWPLADHIISNTQTVKECMVAAYGIPREKITVIRNGLDTDYFQPPEAKPQGPRVLACLARLHPDKDHLTLLRAFKTVLSSFPHTRLWLVGDGVQLPALQAWTRKHLPGQAVQFFGAQMDVRPYLLQASLFVLSSRDNACEAMPNAVLEAMACGLPVVATRAGGVPEAVIHGHTGLLVPERDPQALAEAICRMLAEPAALNAMGQAGRQRAVAEFSFDTMARRHAEVFDHLLAKRTPVLPRRKRGRVKHPCPTESTQDLGQ